MRHRSIITAALAGVTSMMIMAAGCTAHNEVAQVCIDRHTHQRVADWRCHQHDTDWGWWYVPYGYTVPGIGHDIDTHHGSYHRPAGSVVHRRISRRRTRVGGTHARPGDRRITRVPARRAPRRPAGGRARRRG